MSWEGQSPLCKVKKIIFIGQVMNVVSGVHGPFGTLSPSLSLFSISFCPILIPILLCLVHFPLCFLLSSPTVSHTESIANYFISLPSLPPLSPSFPSFMSSCLSFHSGSAVGCAMGCNTGHGSCLSSPLVSCVAASGAASLPLCRSVCPLLLN